MNVWCGIWGLNCCDIVISCFAFVPYNVWVCTNASVVWTLNLIPIYDKRMFTGLDTNILSQATDGSNPFFFNSFLNKFSVSVFNPLRVCIFQFTKKKKILKSKWWAIWTASLLHSSLSNPVKTGLKRKDYLLCLLIRWPQNWHCWLGKKPNCWSLSK